MPLEKGRPRPVGVESELSLSMKEEAVEKRWCLGGPCIAEHSLQDTIGIGNISEFPENFKIKENLLYGTTTQNLMVRNRNV